MFPISCNAFGDIVAAIQIVRDIAKALNESRGAAQDCRDFVQGLESMATVMEVAHRLAQVSSNSDLRESVLLRARQCCEEIQKASERTSGFSALLSAQMNVTTNVPGLRKRLSRRMKMLRWHFMRSSEAEEFVKRFLDQCVLIQLEITLLNEESARTRAQQQEARADVHISVVRDDIAILSESSSIRLDHLTHSLHTGLVHTAASATQTRRQHSEVFLATVQSGSMIVETLAQQNQAMKRALETVQSIPYTGETLQLSSCIFPIFITWIIVLALDFGLTSHKTRWHAHIAWESLCAVVIYLLWIPQYGAIPTTMRYNGENSVILIDFVGSCMHLPLQLCGTLADFDSFIRWLFLRDRRKGVTYVLERCYEILDMASSTALTASAWSHSVTEGTTLQLGILLRQRCQASAPTICPYCNAETLQGPAIAGAPRDWISCMGCSRPFQVSTVPLSTARHSVTETYDTSTSTQDVDNSLESTVNDRASEDIHHLGRIHVIRLVMYEEAGAGESMSENTTNLGGPSSDATTVNQIEPSEADTPVIGGAGVRGYEVDEGANDHRVSKGPGSAAIVRQSLATGEDRRPSNFRLGNRIGRGQFGTVYRALNLNTGQTVAVKRISLEGLEEDDIGQLMNEVNFVKSMRHPNIIKYEGMVRDDNTLSIVLEYAENGSLGQILKAFGKLNEVLVASYVVKILEGLDYLHRSDVVHCDLKAANILTTKDGDVKLSDFGVFLNLRALELNTQTGKGGKLQSRDMAGSAPNWMAPEVIELKGASTKSDIWSLACTVVELLTGRPPYADIADSMTVISRIVEDERPPFPEGCSGPLRDFLELCFRKRPDMRPSAEEFFEHEWLKNHWILDKDIRTQSSIPSHRHVGATLHRADAVRLFESLDEHDSDNVDGPHTPVSPTHKASGPGTEADLMSMREHTFLKTFLGKAVTCRVCMQQVKKSAMLCSQCSLVAHSRCTAAALPFCDLRSQPRLYPQSSERGIILHSESSSRTSLDASPSNLGAGKPLGGANPPSANKKMLRRTGRVSFSPEPMAGSAGSSSLMTITDGQSSAPVLSQGNIIRRKLSTILTGGGGVAARMDRPQIVDLAGTSTERGANNGSASGEARILEKPISYSHSPLERASTSTSSTNTSEAQNKTFKRLRTSLEQSVRPATRSRAEYPPVVPVLDANELGNVKTVKGKEKVEEGSKLRKTIKSRRESLKPPSMRLASASTPTLTPSAPSTPTPVPPGPPKTPRQANTSSNPSSLSNTAPSPQREVIRAASSALCRVMLKSGQLALGARDQEEVEVRMRVLARLERVWGKNVGSSSSSLAVAPPSSAVGEERERRTFADALRDGYVLCQLMNKLRPGSIARVDAREDGRVRTSNVTKFLAAHTSHGLPASDRFMRDDLIEGTVDSLARVAKTVSALINWAEAPGAPGVLLRGGKAAGGIYSGSIIRAGSSTPNLSSYGKSSPRKNTTADSSLPNAWPSLSKAKADILSLSVSSISAPIQRQPPLPIPPPNTPNRKRRPSETADADLNRELEEEGESTARARSPNGESAERIRLGKGKWPDDFMERRPSETANADLSMVSEEEGEPTARARSPNGERIRLGKGKWPDDFMDLNSAPPPSQLQMQMQAIPITPSKSSKSETSQVMASSPPRSPPILIKRPSHDAVLSSSPPRASPPLSLSPLSLSPTRNSPRKIAVIGSSSGSPTSELAPPSPRRPAHRARHSVNAPGLLPKGRDSNPNAGASPTNAGPIMPINLRRDSSPGGAMLKRASTRHVSGGLLAKDRDAARRGSPDSRAGDRDSGSDITTGTERRSSGSGLSSAPMTTTADIITPQLGDQRPRGRFQSEVDEASTRRKPRPNSFDKFAGKGAGARRSRLESMVNLGGAGSSGGATASDLMGPGAGLGLGAVGNGASPGAFGLGGEGGRRNSAGSAAVAARQPLVVREDNRPPTHFQLGNCIGRGQFGAVYRALNLNTGQMVAVKRISLEGLKEEEVRQLMKEVDLVKSLRHPSIVKYEGMARDKDTLSIVLEYAENGSLGQTLKAFGKLNERLVASYVVKILEGLDYLHQSHVVHCDLKAANILTTKNGNVKLADFGVSLNLRAMELSTQTGKDGKAHSRDVVGTPNWMAPEVIELKGARAKSDIWSLACTVVELLTGRPPYADIANSMTVMLRILEDERPPLPEGCSGPLKDFLELCFRKDPEMRPSAEELFEHEWLKKHWGLNKDLRPQDSIPFLRRVSADLHKNDAVRHLASLGEHDSDNGDGHRTPLSPTHKLSEPSTPTTHIGAHPHSYTPEFGPPEADLMSMREHTFVKTSFGKPVICRVCMQHIKKSAVLCSQCSLIAHSRCAAAAPPTCDLRSQLLLYAQFAEHNTTPNAGSESDGPARCNIQ